MTASRRSSVVVATTLAVTAALAITVIGSPRARSFILSLPNPEPHGQTVGTSRPNLVFILTDDQRWDTLSVMPNVRRLLAAHGVTFTNAFVTTSLCCPSRASILTGRYSRYTGVWDNTPPNGGAVAFNDRSTLATWLHDAGYTTAMVGKYLNDYHLLGNRYIPPGWDEWDSIVQEPMTKYYDYTLNQDGQLHTFGSSPSDYSTSVLQQGAVDFIKETQSPFFLYFAPIAPHTPSTPAPQDLNRFAPLKPWRPPSYNEPDAADKPWVRQDPPLDRHGRAVIDRIRTRMVESLISVDRAVAAIVHALAAKGQLDNTDIVFMSDNGYLWGEHRLRDKIWPYEESIRVPMVIRTPWITRPAVDPRMALNIDIAPTLADLAGVTPGAPVDGSSVVPLLRGEHSAWRTAFVEEYLGHRLNKGLPPPFEAIRTERYLYVEYRTGWREMYDLKQDPYELTNLAADPSDAAVRATLTAQLHGLLTAP